jgi:hypothetical protein
VAASDGAAVPADSDDRDRHALRELSRTSRNALRGLRRTSRNALRGLRRTSRHAGDTRDTVTDTA